MAAPTILSSVPSSNEINVYKNLVLTITFTENLLASTVSGSTVFLKNLDSNEIVPCYVSLTSGTISLTPIRVLLPSTSYRITLVGANTAVGVPIKGSDGTAFAVTAHIVFTTGDEISTEAPEKSDDAKDIEGEIDLPSNLEFIPETSYLDVVSTTPQNREFAVDFDLSEISIVFTESIDSSTVSTNSVRVSIGPYYEEDEEYLAYPDTSNGYANFQWQESNDAAGVPFDFTDLTGDLSVADDTVTWSKTDTRDFPRNTKVKVTITKDLTSVGGSTLKKTGTFQFYIEPFPYVVSIDRVRDEFYPYVLSTLTDDLIGKSLYKNALEALDFMRWEYDFRQKNSLFQEYVLNATIVDVFEAIRIEEGLLAGQFKRLGDMAVRYDAKANESIPAKMASAMRRVKEIKESLRGRWTSRALSTVKGRNHPEQRGIWRTRLWHQDLDYALESISQGQQTAGNTADNRSAKVPGLYDVW